MADFKDPTRTPATYKNFRSLSKICGSLVVITGILVLFGWWINNQFLKSIRSDTVPMNPITAIGFILAGITLLLKQEEIKGKRNKMANVLADLVLLTGCLKLFSVITNLHIPFDNLLFRGRLWNPELQHYDTIAPNTAINFVLSAFALLFLNKETSHGRRPSQYIAIVVTLISLVSLYGYIYGITALYSVKTFIPMAIHTAFCFLLLGAGILFAHPDKGSMAVVIGENSGQILFMRFVAFILPLVYGWLKIQGENAGLFSKELGTALFAILTYVVAMFFLARQSVLQHKIRETKRIAMLAIRENEERLQAILDNSGANISLKTILGKYTLVNKQFEKDFNLNLENALGKTDYDLFSRDLARELNQYDHQIIKTGQPKSFEEKYPQQDGIHTYITVKFPLFKDNQRIYSIGAVSTDITKRKHLEDELRKSHQRLFGILDNIGEGVIVADPDGNFIIFNRRAEEILGLGALQVPWDELNKAYGFFQVDGITFFTLEDMPLFKAVKGETADNVEMFIRNNSFPAGKWIAVTGRPVMNEKKEVIAGVIVFRDITARKQLEKLFSDNEKRLKLILTSIGEGVIIINREEHVLLFNKMAEDILGDAPKALTLAEWPTLYGIYDAEGHALLPAEILPLVKALKGEPTEELEILVKNDKAPEGKRVSLTSRPIKDSNGKVTGAIADLKDITEQRKLEDFVKEIQEQFSTLLQHQKP
jgi:PAS domain S-box-containing protein